MSSVDISPTTTHFKLVQPPVVSAGSHVLHSSPEALARAGENAIASARDATANHDKGWKIVRCCIDSPFHAPAEARGMAVLPCISRFATELQLLCRNAGNGRQLFWLSRTRPLFSGASLEFDGAQ